MKIVVTVKLVPDTTADKRIDPTTKRLVRTGVETVLNPFDEYAIEAALQLKEKLAGDTTVTVVTVAPDASKEKPLRQALAMGADDAMILSDPGAEGSDVWGTATALAALIKQKGFDLVLCGTQSTDAGTGELPGMLAELLGVPGLTYVRKFELDGTTVKAERETENGFTRVSVALPTLVSVTKSINEPRYPALKGIMGAKKKTIASHALAELSLGHPIGTDGAKTELTHLEQAPVRGKGRVVKVADGAEGATVILDYLKEKKFV